MVQFLESLLRPPASLIWLAALGLLLRRTRWRRQGTVLAAVSVALLYLLSTPLVVVMMLNSLDRYPPLDPQAIRPGSGDAIVILSASSRDAQEYGREVASAAAMERVRYGAWLHRQLGLPVLITGKNGEYMAQAMEDELGVAPRWLEHESANTHQHVGRSQPLLRAAGIERIFLVTHYWHMPRAMAAFGQSDLEVVAAPMAFRDTDQRWADPRWFVPATGALTMTPLIFHEWIGRVWYRLRYGY